ncbi:MAG: hypothetical protein HRT36_05505, partial [Alphaproteobacteria bacterium]|nr:hypothetical protein [Alphaproteobacteria bacterium]
KNLGEGLSALGQAWIYRLQAGKAEKSRKAFQKQQQDHGKAIGNLLGGSDAGTFDLPALRQAYIDARTTPEQRLMLQGMLGRQNTLADRADERGYEQGIYGRGREDTLADRGEQRGYEQGIRADERGYEQDIYSRTRDDEITDRGDQRAYDLSQNQVKGADGYLYYPDGTRVLPNVEKPQDITKDMQEYVFAIKQGSFTGSFADWLALTNKSQKTTINLNTGNAAPLSELSKLPAGYTYLLNEDGSVKLGDDGVPSISPLHGSQQDRDLQKSKAAAKNKQARAKRDNEIVRQDIERSIALVDDAAFGSATGFWGNLFQYVPGTNAHDLSKMMDAIKASIGFRSLQAMRDSSPTGGALGQVTEKELKYLQSAFGSLEQSQTEEQFIYNLNRLKRKVYKLVTNENLPFDNWQITAPQGGAGTGAMQQQKMPMQQQQQQQQQPQSGGYTDEQIDSLNDDQLFQLLGLN